MNCKYFDCPICWDGAEQCANPCAGPYTPEPCPECGNLLSQEESYARCRNCGAELGPYDLPEDGEATA